MTIAPLTPCERILLPLSLALLGACVTNLLLVCVWLQAGA